MLRSISKHKELVLSSGINTARAIACSSGANDTQVDEQQAMTFKVNAARHMMQSNNQNNGVVTV